MNLLEGRCDDMTSEKRAVTKDAIDMMLEKMGQIRKMLDNMRLDYLWLDEPHVKMTDDLFQYAEVLGCQVYTNGYEKDGFTHIEFTYKGHKFTTFASEYEMCKYKDKIRRMDELGAEKGEGDDGTRADTAADC